MRIACASEPDPASVRQKAATSSPLATRGSQRFFCSSVPKSLIPLAPMDWCAPKKTQSAGSIAPTAAKTRLNVIADAPNPPYSSAMFTPIMPSSAIPLTTVSGNFPSLSCRCESTFAAAHAWNESRIAARFSCSSFARTGKGKTRSSRISPRKTLFVNEGL